MKLKILTLAVISGLLMAWAIAPNQVLKTSLRITVLNDLGNIQENASVQLFKTEEDYRNDTNPVGPAQKTDRKGRVTFKKLAAREYYINAKKGDATNVGRGVKTEKLEEGKVNKLNTVIE